ncbi:MAG: 60S ribosomal protein L18A, partial [Amphiamblys sp. WSBS2006]
MKEYRVVGRQADKEDAPLYMLTVFAKNHVIAKTKFFGAMSKINKIKRTKAEIVSVEELKEQKVLRARTYGVWIRINSNNNPKNIYKEFRET